MALTTQWLHNARIYKVVEKVSIQVTRSPLRRKLAQHETIMQTKVQLLLC
jgi:hypothetical protein